jgi:hypothetical protein
MDPSMWIVFLSYYFGGKGLCVDLLLHIENKHPIISDPLRVMRNYVISQQNKAPKVEIVLT